MARARHTYPGRNSAVYHPLGAVITLVLLLFAPPGAHAAERIGSAVQIVQTVTGEIEANFRYLILRDPVFQDEVIATLPGSASRIVFRDKTELQVGPQARVTLDRFVFDPNPSVARFVISAFDGIFRFASGKLAKTAYRIETPNAVIGVRGTTFVSIFSPDGEQVILLESGLAVTVRDRQGGPPHTLSQPGLSLSVMTDGSITEPRPPPQWALEKLRELNALLRTLDELVRGERPEEDDPPPIVPLPPVQKAALPTPVPVAKPAVIPAPKDEHRKAYPKPPRRALVDPDKRAAVTAPHKDSRPDIRIERRGRKVVAHVERDDDHRSVRDEPGGLKARVPGQTVRNTVEVRQERSERGADRDHAGSLATKDISREGDTRQIGARNQERGHGHNRDDGFGGRDRGGQDRGERDHGGQDRDERDRDERDRSERDRGDRDHGGDRPEGPHR